MIRFLSITINTVDPYMGIGALKTDFGMLVEPHYLFFDKDRIYR